jgi:3',5'-cyclic AMP phosphodiesterase CpdA
MDSIRILHASDLHIADIARLRSPLDAPKFRNFLRAVRYKAAATSYDPNILRAFGEFVRKQTDLRAIVLTGDIATTGDDKDLIKAFKFIDGPASTANPAFPYSFYVEGSLEGIDIPIFLIPGNHDRFEKTFKIFEPGGMGFHAIFSKYWDRDVQPFPVLDEGELTVAIIGADFSLRTSRDCRVPLLNKYAQGKVYSDVLDEMVAVTRRTRNETWSPAMVVLWAIHFPPDYPGEPRVMRLLNSRHFIKAANECGVEAILTGHTHKQLTYRTPRMNFQVYCAGTASEYQARYGHSFQILNITNSWRRPQIAVEHYEFKRDLAEFRLAKAS